MMNKKSKTIGEIEATLRQHFAWLCLLTGLAASFGVAAGWVVFPKIMARFFK